MIFKKIPFSENTVTQTELQTALASYAGKSEIPLSSAFSLDYETSASEHKIWLKYSGVKIGSFVDASSFVKDGMLQNVALSTINGVKCMVFTFNADSGKQELTVPLADIGTIPVAGPETLGGVKINGNNLTIASDGTLSASVGTQLSAGSGLEIHGGVIAISAHIPDKTSDLTNDSGYLTEHELTGYATQQWVLDKNYLSSHQPLTAYYTKTEIDGKIGAIDAVLDEINGEVV